MTTRLRALLAIFLVAAYAYSTGTAAQNAPEKPAPKACPAPAEVEQAHLLGLWRAEFASPAETATVLLEKSREYTEGVSGGINRNGQQSRLEGDVEDGALELDESDDGLTISATWTGKVVDQSCGKEIRGVRKSSSGAERAFVLRKASGW